MNRHRCECSICTERGDEIERLQDAKRAALKLADERAIEANGLRARVTELMREKAQLIEIASNEMASLRAQLATANERVAEMQYEAGMYQSLYELSGSRLAKAKLALENIATWRKVNMVGEFEPGLRDIIRSMTDAASNALDSLTDEQGKP